VVSRPWSRSSANLPKPSGGPRKYFPRSATNTVESADHWTAVHAIVATGGPPRDGRLRGADRTRTAGTPGRERLARPDAAGLFEREADEPALAEAKAEEQKLRASNASPPRSTPPVPQQTTARQKALALWHETLGLATAT
jgi:hypothetical protein